MFGPGALHALLALEKRTPLLQMTPDELVRTYMTPLSLGVFFSCFFYGMFVAYLYFTQFKPDTWINRGVVVLLLCFTTADTVAGAVRIFRMTVQTPNNLAYILDVTKRPEDWLATVMLLITVLTAQLFMSYRIVTFARHMSAWNHTPEGAKRGQSTVYVLMAGLGAVWLLCLAACAANMAVFYQVTNYMQLLVPTSRLARLFRGTSLIMPCVLCLMDLLIATGFGVSDHILGTLMNVIIRNGAMMAAIMLTQLLVTLFRVLWGNFMPLFYGKLHALTVLAILTEPRVARAEWFKSQESDGPSPSIVAPPGQRQRQRQRRHSGSGPVDTPHMDYTRPSQYDRYDRYGYGHNANASRDDLTDRSRTESGASPRTPTFTGSSAGSIGPGRHESEATAATAATCGSGGKDAPVHGHAHLDAKWAGIGARRRKQSAPAQANQPHSPIHPGYSYIPANPRCAHCDMPWLPSDLDTPISYIGGPICEKDVTSPSASASPPTAKGDHREEEYFGLRTVLEQEHERLGAGHRVVDEQRRQRLGRAHEGLGMGRPGQAARGEVVQVPVLPRDGAQQHQGIERVQIERVPVVRRQLSFAEMLDDDEKRET